MFLKSIFPLDPIQERSGHENGDKMEAKYSQNSLKLIQNGAQMDPELANPSESWCILANP